ncbi:Ig-like domain-containing protein [Leeuwenhoekiella sp. W20_SRS_FM14]|uniref:Ig-like domain-containing protein n=1 Tax=Leeuwenhoekiella sp. W20_SRS_FM14 TaxID=3240270 RepID=UPI003F99E55C
MVNFTFKQLEIRFVTVALLFLISNVAVLGQDRTFATTVIDNASVTNLSFATDQNLSTQARIRANSGVSALGIEITPPTVGHIELGYNTAVLANTTTYIQIETQDQLLDVLVGGTLGGLVGDVLDIVLGGQEVTIEAKNGGTSVLTVSTTNPSAFNTETARVLIGPDGNYYIALTPNQNYTSIRVTNSTGSELLGLNNTRDLFISGVFTASGSNFCNEPAFTSFNSTGITLDALQLAGSGVTNPEFAIDSDPSTFSQISLGILAVAGSIEQVIYFDTPTQPTEDFKIALRVDPSLLALGLANNVELLAYNGTTLVSSSSLSSLLNLDLLGLLQSNAIVQVPFDVAGPADRIVVRYESLVNASVTQRIDLFDIAVTSGIPVLDSASQNVETCAGETADLIATTATTGAELRWYDSATGGNLLAAVASGDTFTTPVLTGDTTFYVASFLAGCAEESGRVAVTVTVNPIPQSGDITVLGLDLPICIPEILNIVPTTALNGSFKYYLDANGDVEITNGLVDGNLTYTINPEGELEVEGLTEAESPYRVYISLVDAVTGCENAPGDLKVVDVTLDGGPQPTIALNPVTTDGIVNTSEALAPVTITGTVGGDAEAGDPVTVTVNTFDYATTVTAGLTFSVDVAGAQLVADSDLTIEAEVTASGLLCQNTVSTSMSYSLDLVPPTVPTVNTQITNNTTPTITGTADSVDNLVVDVNGVTYTEGDGNLTDNGDDTYNLVIPSGNEISEGTYDVVATAADAAGNSSTDTTTNELTIDFTNPTIPTVNTQTTSDTTPTVTGTADSVDALTVVVNSVTYIEGDGNLVDNGDNTWTLIIPAGNELINGVYEVLVTATDLAGNMATDITTNELTIDNTIPTTPTVVAQVTSNTRPTITGTADSADDLTVTVDGVDYNESGTDLTDNGNDTWTLTIPSPIAEGTYNVTAVVVGIGGTATDPTMNELIIDTTNPVNPTVDALTTNDTTPTITGTADSVDALTVVVNGVTYTEGDGNLTDNGDNTFSLVIPAGDALPDGTYDVDATATDAAGNVSSDITTDELVIDTTAPNVPTVDALVTNSNTPTITGTADSVDDLTVVVNGVTYTEGDGNLTDNGDNTFTLVIPAGNALPDGTYDVVATATDAAGNTSSDITTDELVIDTAAPTVPTVDTLLSNNSTPTITGTADSVDNLTVVVNGVTYSEGDGNLTDNGDNTFTLIIPAGNALPDGTYDVVATATDAAGNASSDITTDELVIDRAAPTVPTVNTQITNNSTPTITGTADSVDDLTVVVNGVTYIEGDGNLTDNGDNTFTLIIPAGDALPDETYDVVATATDAAGNSSSDITTDELMIDTAAPTVPTIDALVTNSNTPTITGTADSIDNLTLAVNGITYTEGDGNLTDNGDNTFSLVISAGDALPDGTYDVVATATDAAGNSSSDITTDELVIDTAAPTVPTVNTQITNNSTPTITGTSDSVDDLTVVVNGVTYIEGDGNLTDNGDSTWALIIPAGDALPDGTYDVVATATDAAGNTSSDITTDELVIDTAAPTVPTVNTQITNNSTPTITGAADSVDDLTVVVNGVTYIEGDGNLTDNGDNTFTLIIPAGDALPDGTYDVVATATDAAGNASSDITTDELVIDTAAPTVPTVDTLVTNSNAPEITGTADSVDDLTVVVNGITYTEGDGNLIDNGDNTFTLIIPAGNALPDGTYDVFATATDAAGNASSDITTDELVIDTAAPTVPTVNTQITNNSTPTITGTADSVDDLTVVVNGVTYIEGDGNLTDNGDNTFSLVIPAGNALPDGTYDVVATATDAAGNASSDITTDELMIDTAAPTVPTVNTQITNNSTPTITGTSDSVDNLTVVVNGITYTEGDGNLTDNGDDTFTLIIPVGNALPDGTYDVVATATDAAGNTSSDITTDELVIDTAAPTVPAVDALVTNNSTPTITGTADSVDDLTVVVNGVTYTEGDGNLTDNGDNTFTLIIPAGDALPDGTYDVDATATDAAGNTSSDITIDELVIDRAAPTVPTVNTQITNNSTPTITGTADSVDDLTVVVNGVTYIEGDGNLTDNGDNTFTLIIPAGDALPDETYDVVATATDAAGNSSSDITTDELVIDTAAPTVPTIDALVTNSNTPTITGTADSVDDLNIVVNGITYTEGDGNLTDNGDDTWTLIIPAENALPDGTYDVVATAADAAGNASSDITTDELVIDTAAPTVPTVDTLLSNNSTPTITGTADSVDDLTVVVNGVTYIEGDGNLTDNGDNTFTLIIPAVDALPDGAYDVVATATDAAGNASSDITTDELVIDTAAPTVPTVDALVTNNSTPTITGAADSVDNLTLTVNGITYSEGDGNLTDNGDDTWTLNIPAGDALPDGTYDVVATATDAAGNASSDITIDELVIDTAAPTVPTVDTLLSNNSTPTITGTADSVDNLTVVVNGVTYTEGDGNLTDNGDSTWALIIPAGDALPDGTYDVVATATDAAGNASSDITTDELVIDTTAPTVPTVNTQITNNSTPTITGTANSVDDLTVVVNGVTYSEGDGNLTDNGDNTFTLIIPAGDALPDGTYDVVATATDAAGNASSDITTDELVIDTAAPTVPTVNTQITNNSTPTITGTADSVDDLTVVVNGITYTEGDGNLTDNGDSTFALIIPAGDALPDGTYDVVATATDAAGNASSDITTDELVIDTAAPTVPTVDTLLSNNSTPTITGTADSIDDLAVVVNGVTYTEGDGNLTDNGDNTFTLIIPAGNALPDGTYDVVATATDAAGNASSDITTDELVIDTAAPTVPTVNTQITNNSTPTITGTADSVDDLNVVVNGITYTEGDGNLTDNGDNTFTLVIPAGDALPDGTYDVVATATDAVGNASSDITTDELVIDTVAPTVPTVDGLVTNSNTPTITGTADSIDDLAVVVNGITYTEGDGNLTDNGDNTFTLIIPAGNALPDGTYDVVATATDAAGNASSDITTDELVIDTAAPIVPTVNTQITNNSTPTITGTADSVDNLTVVVNGVTYIEGDGNLTDNGDNTFTLIIPVGNALPDGTYDVSVTVTDALGNSSNDTTVDELVIDTSTLNQPTVPTVTSQITSDSTPLITGTADSVDMLMVSVNGFTYAEGDGNLVDNTNDTWTLTIPDGNEIPQGTYDVVASVTNTFGNTLTDVTTNELTIDVGTPVGDPNQSFCAADMPTLADIVLNTNAIKWYGQASGGVALDLNTPLVNGVTYYAALTVGSFESSVRLGVTVSLTEPVEASLDASVDAGCLGAKVVYTTEPGMIDYFWSVSTGGRIVSGGTDTDNSVTVIWDVAGTQNVSVNYLANDACLTETSAEIDLEVSACSDMTISKTVNNLNPAIGEDIIYTIEVTNTGEVALRDVIVDESLPSGLEFLSFTASVGDYNNTTGMWSIPVIDANATATLTVTVMVLDTGNYLNIARIVTSNPVDANPDNNSAELEIDPDCLMVFNEFSPNGDGMNDVFTVRCIENYPNNTVQVFNRNGQLVFDASGYSNTWNGDSNVSSSIQKSSGLPAGTYYYVLEINDGSRSLTGWVYIAR